GCNPVSTQIPNAHFLVEARYNGATLVTIAPDYNPSSIHSDLWVPVRPGGDAALALAMCKIIIDEKRYDETFLKEQTDLPILVRSDNHRLLRQSDLVEGGNEEVFYWYDLARRRISEVERNSLELESVDPALEGEFEVRTLGGLVAVTPVFERLKARLADYGPEAASEHCGTPPEMIRDLAIRVASANAATNVTSSNFSKYYHGNLVERSQALLFALCGHIGKKGGGFVAFPFITNDGFDMFAAGRSGVVGTAKLYAKILPQTTWLKWKGYTEEMVAYELARGTQRDGIGLSCGTLFWAVHGGLLEYSGRSAQWDPHMKRPLAEFLKESLDAGWQYVWPRRGDDPRMLFSFGSNILRRVRAYPLLLKHLWPKLTRMVVLDWRMTSTGMFADYVLPVSAWYERNDHKWATMLMPFLHSSQQAVDSGDAWHEWRIFTNLARRISEVAKAKGIDRYRDHLGEERSLADLYREFTYDGKFNEHSESDVAGELVRRSTNLGDVEWKRIQEQGYTRFTSPGGSSVSIGNATEMAEGDTVTPLTKHVIDKEPYPTTSRRIQFYIDHPFYLELDEALPRHKAPPTAGGDYPLILTGGHTRWSIHAQWRDDSLMLRQQRGVPLVNMSVEDARARGIDDGDEVVVRNDLDSFRIQAKVSPAIKPGQLIIYHAWENYQFAEGKGFQNLIPTPMNPVELAGGQFHLRPMTICMQPGQFDRDTRVEVEKA
ncbi:MAG: molybdopterin dinucleotide binding domain-containing protein, partial [Candidatus Binatia bacterium]